MKNFRQYVSEISKKTKSSYLDKAVDDHQKRFTQPRDPNKPLTKKEKEKGMNTLRKRRDAIQKVSKELKGKTHYRDLK